MAEWYLGVEAATVRRCVVRSSEQGVEHWLLSSFRLQRRVLELEVMRDTVCFSIALTLSCSE